MPSLKKKSRPTSLGTLSKSKTITPSVTKTPMNRFESGSESSGPGSPTERTAREKGKRRLSDTKKASRRSDDELNGSERPTIQRVQFDFMEEEDDEDERSTPEKDLHQFDKENRKSESEAALIANNPADAYFLAHGKSNPTSSNLFSSKPNWKEPLPVSEFLRSFNPQPLRSAESSWEQWTAESIEGYSLLFHGLGSKRVTLNDFVENHLVGCLGWEGLVINGFQTGVDLSSLLDDLEDIIRDDDDGEEHESDPPKRKATSLELLESRAQRLCTLFSQQGSAAPHCVIMVHNLDGLPFRNPRVQTILGTLAAQPHLHLLATIDHIYAPILLGSHLASARPYDKHDSTSLETVPSSYNFLYHHLPTDTPYTIESLMSGTMSNLLPSNIFPTVMVGSRNSKLDISQNAVTTPKAALQVLSSLTEKAKLLFRILAGYQLSRYESLPSTEAAQIDGTIKNPNSQEDRRAPRVAIPGRRLFELARSEFVTSSESQMEALLVEFRDHGIILGSLNPSDDPAQEDLVDDQNVEDDEEWLWVGLAQNDLEEVISKMEDV